MFRMISILAAVCFCSSLILGVTYKLTKPAIEQQALQAQNKSLKAVFPQADTYEPGEKNGVTYFTAQQNGKSVGYCLVAESQGYSSVIKMMTGMDMDGILQGVAVISQQETPGLGTQIVDVKPGEKTPWFLQQFKGKNAKTITLADINAITGATISSKAVVDGIRKTTDEFYKKAD